jgi:rSAM/selenodomain-associated transferase 1
VLVVMAKAPREGHTKTRLHGVVPSRDVARLADCMLRDTLELARSIDGVHVAVMCPAADVTELTAMLPGVNVVAQDGAGLAAALTSVFRRFVEAGFSRVIAIDADSPHLPAAVVRQAFASLDERDLVVGPTEDGGYYLVGASAAHPGLFDAAPLGTSSAYDALCAYARGQGLSVATARVWYDVDLAADLLRLASDLRDEPARAPRTAALLASWDGLRGGGETLGRLTRRTAASGGDGMVETSCTQSKGRTKMASGLAEGGGRAWALWAAGAAILGALLAFAALDPGQGTPPFFLLLVAASAGYLFAILQLARGRHPSPRVLAALALLAFAWRIPLLLAPTHPRADVTRYVWDARTVRAGLSPYAVVPADPAAAHLRTPESWPVNNPDVPSPYPPGAHLFFLLATAPEESVLAIKAALVGCEVLLALALWRWLLAIGAGAGWLLAYLWNPLTAVEVARQGHVDALGALLLVLAALGLARRRTLGGSVALALAVAVKPLPIVLAPLLWRRVSLRDATAGIGVLAALYLPFWIRGRPALGSVPEIVRRFRFNGPVFEAAAAASTPALAAALAIIAGLAVAAWARARLPVTSPAAWAWPLAAALVFAPLVYPWYLVWFAPFLVARSTLPLLVWTVSIQATYVVWHRTPGAPWLVPAWALLVEYGALALAAVWAWSGARQRVSRDLTP